MSDMFELVRVCDAILAVAGEPVSAETLAAAAGGEITVVDVEAAIAALQARYGADESGLVLEKVAGGWRLATRPELDGVLRSYLGVRSRTRLSQAALETLSIVAYRQPVTLPEISFVRGVNSAGVVRTLVERGLVKVSGRKKVVGTPLLYRTTREFLVHFGLDDLSALPSLEEIDELGGDDASVS